MTDRLHENQREFLKDTLRLLFSHYQIHSINEVFAKGAEALEYFFCTHRLLMPIPKNTNSFSAGQSFYARLKLYTFALSKG
jgi:hypothetical protein